MKRINPFLSFLSRNGQFIVVALMFVIAICGTIMPADSAAQLPNATTATTNLKSSGAPLIALIRVLLGVICVVLAIIEAFKAAKGGQGGKGWLAAVLLLVVGGTALFPDTILGMVGLGGLCQSLSGWGICGAANTGGT
jgi:hypothetical protein